MGAVHDAGFDVQKFKTAGPIRVREDLVGTGYVRWCHEFIRAGAQYCGGCCGSTPAEIQELSQTLSDMGWTMDIMDACTDDKSVSTAASENESLEGMIAVGLSGRIGAASGCMIRHARILACGHDSAFPEQVRHWLLE